MSSVFCPERRARSPALGGQNSVAEAGGVVGPVGVLGVAGVFYAAGFAVLVLLEDGADENEERVTFSAPRDPS